MTLNEITLAITLCSTCGTILIATKQKRQDFTDAEMQTIQRIAGITNNTIRWHRRSIPDWAHCHLE